MSEACEYIKAAQAMSSAESRMTLHTPYPSSPVSSIVLAVWDCVLGPSRLFTWNVNCAAQEDRVDSRRESDTLGGDPNISRSHSNSLSDIDGDIGVSSHLQTIQATVHPCPLCDVDQCVCDQRTPDHPINDRPMSDEQAGSTQPMSDSQSTMGETEMRQSQTTDSGLGEMTNISVMASMTVGGDSKKCAPSIESPADATRSTTPDLVNTRTVSPISTNAVLPDDDFCALQSLSDELYGNGGYGRGHSTNRHTTLMAPLETKLISCPSRHMLMLTYAFGARQLTNEHRPSHRWGAEALHHRSDQSSSPSVEYSRYAVSFVCPLHMWDYIAHRRRWLLEAVKDTLLPKARAMIAVDSLPDIVCHLTSELQAIIDIMCRLEHERIEIQMLQIHDTHLANVELITDTFLHRAISIHQATLGATVVVGDNRKLVQKMLATLHLFTPYEQQYEALYTDEIIDGKPRDTFTPHVRLQAAKPCDLTAILQSLSLLAHPSCIVHIDDRRVFACGTPLSHLKLRATAREAELMAMIGRAPIGRQIFQVPMTRSTEIHPQVIDLLRCMALLPYEDTARMTLLHQFHMHKNAEAKALTHMVLVQAKNTSARSKDSLPLRKTDIERVRTGADLSSDTAFWSCVKYADAGVKCEFAQYITKMMTNK